MTHTKIEMDVMRAIERACESFERQVDALESIANDIKDIKTFLMSTTIEQVEMKTVELKKKNRRRKKSGAPKEEKSAVDELRKQIEKDLELDSGSK